MSSVIVAKASVILAFKFVISGTGVENTLSLTYPHKKKSRGMISGDRGGQGVGPSLPIHLLEMLHPKTDEHVNPSVEVHRLVRKLSTVETLLTEVQCKFPNVQVINVAISVCNQGKTLCLPCSLLECLTDSTGCG